MRKASAIELGDAQREALLRLLRSNTMEVRLARRAGIVLVAADGFVYPRLFIRPFCTSVIVSV